jgi:hypothetical protein
VLEETRLHLVRADDAVVAAKVRGRERVPVSEPDVAQRAEDAAFGVEDPAVRVAERPAVGL